MTLEEIKFAIEFFEENMPAWDYEANIYCADACHGLGELICTEPEGYIFRTAIEALEKQIPKKPKHTAFGTECSICGSLVKFRGCARFSHCPYCGQRIDWSEE